MTTTPERFPHWPSDELERQLTEATKDPGARPGFLRALLDGGLWIVPLPESKFEVKDCVVQPGGRLALLNVEVSDKMEAIAAFTTQATATASCKPGTPLMRMPTRELFQMTRGATIAINPVGPFGKVFVPEEIEELLSGLVSTGEGSARLAVEGSQVLIGSAKNPPTKMMDELSVQFRRDPRVRRAHLGIAAFSGASGPPHPIVGIDFEGELKDLVPTLELMLTRGAAEANSPIDVIDLNSSSLGETLKNTTEPFYVRA